MKVVHNGEHITIQASFLETAALTDALRRSIAYYESKGATEFANEARQLVDNLTNDIEYK